MVMVAFEVVDDVARWWYVVYGSVSIFDRCCLCGVRECSASLCMYRYGVCKQRFHDAGTGHDAREMWHQVVWTWELTDGCLDVIRTPSGHCFSTCSPPQGERGGGRKEGVITAAKGKESSRLMRMRAIHICMASSLRSTVGSCGLDSKLIERDRRAEPVS
jgi:hypothetical protein